MKCNNCGINLSDEAVFCTNCGKKLEEKVMNETVMQEKYSFNHIPNNNSAKRKISSAQIAIVVVFVALIGVTIWQRVTISKQKIELESYEEMGTVEAVRKELEECEKNLEELYENPLLFWDEDFMNQFDYE